MHWDILVGGYIIYLDGKEFCWNHQDIRQNDELAELAEEGSVEDSDQEATELDAEVHDRAHVPHKLPSSP